MTRRKFLTLIAFALFVGAAYVQIGTFGMNLKGTETRSIDAAMDAVKTLIDHGAIEAEPDSDQVWELSRLIQQPVKDQIFITQRRYVWTSAYMAIVGVAVILVAWFPVRRPQDLE